MKRESAPTAIADAFFEAASARLFPATGSNGTPLSDAGKSAPRTSARIAHPKIDELLDEAVRRQNAAMMAAARGVEMAFKVQKLTSVFIKLHGHAHGKTAAAERARPLSEPRTDSWILFRYIRDCLIDYPAAWSPRRRINLRLAEHEARYICVMIANLRHDEIRAENYQEENFVSIEGMNLDTEAAEDYGLVAAHFEPPAPRDSDDPEAAFIQSEIRKALAGLPAELAELAGMLPSFNGNVSALARHFRQPQRKTARQITRIQRYFSSRGLQPV